MKGPIIDTQVHIKPSKALVDFIHSLDDYAAVPENVLRIYESHGNAGSKKIFDEFIPKKVLTDKEQAILQRYAAKDDSTVEFSKIPLIPPEGDEEEDSADVETIGANANSKSKLNKTTKKTGKADAEEELLLNINDLRWLDAALEKRRSADDFDVYLHELLADSQLVLPRNEIIPRNPELEARCVKLREEQQEREYRKMTKDVDATRQHMPEETVAYQVKAINRQLIAVLQFIFSVIAGFAFGFIGLELIFGNLDFGFRLFMGVMCALIIALAEIYFLAKKLSEYDQVMEDIPMPTRKPLEQHPHQD